MRGDVFMEIRNVVKQAGIDFATGVPCGVLRKFIQVFSSNPRILHIPAFNEREAVGIAAGAYLGGKVPVLYMQNSGLFVSSNEFASIFALMHIPVLSVISHRGCEGEDAPQHMLTGEHTLALLDGLGIFHFHRETTVLNLEMDMKVAAQWAKEKSMPAAILVRRGWDKNIADDAELVEPQPSIEPVSMGTIHGLVRGCANINREDAIDKIVEIATSNPEESRFPAIISTTGLISRSLFERHDNPNVMYNPGGFGQTSAMGCGFAIANSTVRTIIIDGDASALADVGNIVQIGLRKPKRLIHVILDNEAYGSCSEERSMSSCVNLASIAASSGYRNIFNVNTSKGLESALMKCLAAEGPNMIIAKIRLGGRRDFARPLEMELISRRFRDYFSDRPALV